MEPTRVTPLYRVGWTTAAGVTPRHLRI